MAASVTGSCPLDVPILLRVGGQLALRQGARFPATVEGVREQMTPDNRLSQHLVNPLSVHRAHTYPLPAAASMGRAGPASGAQSGCAQPGLLPRGWAARLGCGAGRSPDAAGLARRPAGPDPAHVGDPLPGRRLAADLGQPAAGPPRAGRRPVAHARGGPGDAGTTQHRGGGARGLGRQPQQRVLGRSGGHGLRRVDGHHDRRPGQCASRRPGAPCASTSCAATPRSASAAPPRGSTSPPSWRRWSGSSLHVAGPAPAWTADVLILAGPLLAFSGRPCSPAR